MRSRPFLEVVLDSHNELRTSAEFSLFGKRFYCDSVKIDTGCPRTTILTERLAISRKESYRLKQRDNADQAVRKRYSLGVNDTDDFRKKTKSLFRKGEYDKMINVSYAHMAKDFFLGGIVLGDIPVLVNYNRIGNILIGMDVIKRLESHISTTPDGETIFLSNSFSDFNQRFDQELYRVFKLKRE